MKDDQWNNFGINFFNGTKGSVGVSLDITNPDKKKMLVSGVLDLAPAAVKADMLNWKKPANVPAVLKFTANTAPGKPVIVSALSLHGPQIMASGDAMLSPDMSQVLSVNLVPLIVGRTNVEMHFNQVFGADGVLHFDAKGVSLDVDGLRGGNDPDRADPRPKQYNIQVDKLYTSKFGEIDNAKVSASRDQQGWMSMLARSCRRRYATRHRIDAATGRSSQLTISSNDSARR